MTPSYTRDNYNSLIYQYAQATIINNNITSQTLQKQLDLSDDFFGELIAGPPPWAGRSRPQCWSC